MPKIKDELGRVLRAVQFAAHQLSDRRRRDAKAGAARCADVTTEWNH
jgi:hypothetical protein